MDRRRFLRSSAVAVLSGATAPDVLAAAKRPGAGDRVSTTSRRDPRALIMDAMGELRPVYEPPLVREMLASGIDSITVTLCDPKFLGAEALDVAVDGLMEYDRYLRENPELFVKASSVKDIDEARRSGRMAVFYLYQNSEQFGDDLDRVEMFYRLGLTSCQVTYNTRNRAGVGCQEDGDDGGLTDFGRELIDRMNALGMLVDLSHANMRTMADVVDYSRVPVIVSHTACAAVHAHVRNTTDENMRSLADRGGVVGICQLRPFLTTKKEDNLHAYFDHIRHAVQVAGIEHVCIGSDRDHRVIELTEEYLAELRSEVGYIDVNEMPWFIHDLNGPRRMEVIWDGLVSRGYSEDQVERIMGQNLYRLYAEVIR